MLQQYTRFFDVGRYIDASVRHQQFRQFFLQFRSCAVDIQNRDHDGIRFCHPADKRDGIFQRISFHAHQNHVRMFLVVLHIRCFHINCLRIRIPETFQRQSMLFHSFQMAATGNQCHIFSCLCHKISNNSAGSSGSYDCILHLCSPFFFASVTDSDYIQNIIVISYTR